jgi:hypothetical protein
VSSYIFNFDVNRRYVLGLVSLAFLPALVLFVLGVFLEPLYGDLTRIGSYSEREFGWNKPQFKFTKQLFTKDQYAQYYDVVVLGDSFSRIWPQHQWQNYVVATTGWSVTTLDINLVKLESILDNPVFRKTPPKVFVLESVERYFPGHIKDGQPCKPSSKLKDSKFFVRPPLAQLDKLEKSARHVDRERDWSDVKLGYVIKYLWNSIWRTVNGAHRTDARKVALVGSTLFSSGNKQEMLVYKEDFQKASRWQEVGLQEMTCRIEQIRKLVEANGKTRFVLMVAPDKLTAYSDFVRDKGLRNLSMMTQLAELKPEVIPRIDLALKSAIRAGEQDVYLPDDTHWGSSGHRITAEAFLGFLQRRE